MSFLHIQHILKESAIPDAEQQKLFAILTKKTLQKGTCFISEGDVPRQFAFVEQGLFRYLYIDQNGNEYTKNFLIEGHFIVSYSAMVRQQPSKMFIEALEDSVVHTIDYLHWQKLRAGHSCWDLFLIALLEKAFFIKETRERELLLLEARERYANFKKEFPTLEARVKQHQVASYLGITPVSLSRIKKQADINIG